MDFDKPQYEKDGGAAGKFWKRKYELHRDEVLSRCSPEILFSIRASRNAMQAQTCRPRRTKHIFAVAKAGRNNKLLCTFKVLKPMP
jgi:hypothetical protein